MVKILAILTILVILTNQKCLNPPTPSSFQNKDYLGKWYEIAKYQTAGGAYFEKDCTCTEIDVLSSISGSLSADQSCIKKGKKQTVKAELISTSQPGKFIEKISINKVGYWVIQLDSETAIQYDCQETLGITNYCIHIMSRKTSLSNDKLQELSKYALSLGLNNNNLSRTMTDQFICRSSFNLMKE